MLLTIAFTVGGAAGPVAAQPFHPDHRQPTPSGLAGSRDSNPDPADTSSTNERQETPLERALDESARRDLGSICRGCDR
jgi:hypothetical protein